MSEWAHEMKRRDQALQDSSAHEEELPAVRKMKTSKLASSQVDKNEAGPSRAKGAIPRDYTEWDKFDVDKEILKMELEDERKREQIAKNKKLQEKKKKIKNEEENLTLKSADNLSLVEKECMATREKDRGNEYYRSGDFEQAVKCYSSSIMLCPTPAAYNNRAMAQLKLQKYGEVIADCNQVLEAEPLNVKALHRRGVAHQGKNSYEQAYEDFSKVMELEPENRAAKLLVDQMRKKLEPAVKSVRLSIADECYQPHGFVFPSPKPNIPVNEWGLAKVMCRCNGTPSWVYKKPPKCKICQKKRAERRAKQEEEARKVTEGNEVIVDTNNGENSEIDQMQTDEKGSGDMRATEKIVEVDTVEDCCKNQAQREEDACINIEKPYENMDSKMIDKISTAESTITKVENITTFNDKISTAESTIAKVENDTTFKYDIINKEISKNEREGHKKSSSSNEIVNSKTASTEVNKSKTEFDSDTKVLSNEDVRKPPKEVKQKSLAPSDNSSGKQMKVEIANKYKRNINTEQEASLEQCEGTSSAGTITSPFEFVKIWESLKISSDLLSHAQVLRSIKPSDLISVIGNKLDGQMLSIILMCLEKNFAPELALEYLNNIVQLPRFNIVILFLEASEKQAAYRLLEKLENSGIHPSGDLRKAFTC